MNAQACQDILSQRLYLARSGAKSKRKPLCAPHASSSKRLATNNASEVLRPERKLNCVGQIRLSAPPSLSLRGLARCLAFFGAWQTIASKRCLPSGVPRPPGPQFLASPPASSAAWARGFRQVGKFGYSLAPRGPLFSNVLQSPGPQLLASVPLRLAASAPGSRY